MKYNAYRPTAFRLFDDVCIQRCFLFAGLDAPAELVALILRNIVDVAFGVLDHAWGAQFQLDPNVLRRPEANAKCNKAPHGVLVELGKLARDKATKIETHF